MCEKLEENDYLIISNYLISFLDIPIIKEINVFLVSLIKLLSYKDSEKNVISTTINWETALLPEEKKNVHMFLKHIKD